MSMPGKILIIRLSSLGDILHTLPAFQDVRKSFPHAQIDWLVADTTRFLLAAVPGIDEIIAVDLHLLKRRPWQRDGWRRLAGTLIELRAKRYDISIDFQGLLKTALLSCLSGARIRLGYSRDIVRERPADWFYHRKVGMPQHPVHVVELNRHLVQAAGACEFPLQNQIAASAADTLLVQSLLDKRRLSTFVVLNPGGGWPTKRWDPARYGLLARRIQATLGLPIVVTTGPGEEYLYEIMAIQCRREELHHLQLTFLQLIPLLQRARLLVGGDTGPFHLACAVGTPVVGIFGPTAPVRNGPWGGGDGVVVRTLPCSFCYGRKCPRQMECMDIGVEEVFDTVTRRLGRQP